MTKAMHIFLRAGERIYVNGAVLRVDRKVSIEFLNTVTFLLENHVIQSEDASTPLRQLYFIIQTMLIDPPGAAAAREVFEKSHALLLATFDNEEIVDGLKAVRSLVDGKRMFESLKVLRGLFPIEDRVIGAGMAATAAPVQKLEVA
jgi:flagellar protein FlbT